MRRVLVTIAGILAGLASPAAATADETIAQIARPGPVSTFDGRVLWSEYDAAAQAYFLTQRFGTTTARLPVRPRSVPFDVDVGRKLGNDTVAVYSRRVSNRNLRGPGGIASHASALVVRPSLASQSAIVLTAGSRSSG